MRRVLRDQRGQVLVLGALILALALAAFIGGIAVGLPPALAAWLRYAAALATHWWSAWLVDRPNQRDALLAAALAAALSALAVRLRMPAIHRERRAAAFAAHVALFLVAVGLGLAAAWPMLSLLLRPIARAVAG